MDTPITHRLRMAIYGAGFSQQTMADALGISKQSVGQFLDGRGTGKKHWVKIADLCKTTVEWIASGTGAQPTWAATQPIPADVGVRILEELRELRAEVTALRKLNQPASNSNPAADFVSVEAVIAEDELTKRRIEAGVRHG